MAMTTEMYTEMYNVAGADLWPQLAFGMVLE